MIELYTGTPGSGKSLHCASVIYKWLNSGKGVIANFDINLTVFKRQGKIGAFTYKDNSELSARFLYDYALEKHKKNVNGHISENQTLLVIDECQLMFNARSWESRGRVEWCTFFTQHRKYGYKIILITQFDRLIDRQIRSLVEYQIIHRKVSNFKAIGFFLGLVFRGNLFIAVTQWYGVREKVSSEWFFLRPRLMCMYDSYKIFHDTTEQTSEVKRGSKPEAAPAPAPAEAAAEDAGEDVSQQVIALEKSTLLVHTEIEQNGCKWWLPGEWVEISSADAALPDTSY